MIAKILVFFAFVLPFQTFAGNDNIHLILVNGIAESQVDPNMVLLQMEFEI